MLNINEVTICGCLGRDPDLRYGTNNLAFVSLAVATNRRVKNADGQYENATDWNTVVAFGKTAETIAEYLHKRLRLQMKGNWQVFPLKARPLDYVGYRFYQDHTTMRRKNFLRFTRQCRKVRKKIERHSRIAYRTAAGLLSRIGQLKHCDSVAARKKYVDPIGVRILKEVVRNESKRRQCAGKCVLAGGAA